jgi:hypothetical protein
VPRIGREIAQGLEAAHKRGLIHRDIKPANIWLEGEPGASATGGRVKIIDFGLARSADKDSQLTQQGSIVGTPGFMAPEQAKGGDFDSLVDLFSLGCVLYEMCTGKTAFQGDHAVATLLAVAVEEPTPPRQLNPEVPPGLNDLIVQLMAKKPDQRPASAREVADRLQALERQPAPPVAPASDPPVAASSRTEVQPAHPAVPPEPPTTPLASPVRRWQRPLLVAAGVLVALLPAGYFFAGGKTAPDTRPEPSAQVRPRDGAPPKPADNPKRVLPAPSLGEAAGERRAAERVLALGGKLTVRAGDRLLNALAAGTDPGPMAVQVGDRAIATHETVQELPAGPFQVVAVSFAGNYVYTDDGLKHLTPLANLAGLSLTGTRVGDAGLGHLEALTTLRFLTLEGTRVGDAGLEHLKPLTNLTHLNLAGTAAGDAGLESLKALTNLTHLNLAGTALGSAGLERLLVLTGLTHLDLGGTGLSDAGEKQLLGLLRGLPRLQGLDLTCTRLSARAVAALRAAAAGKQLAWSEPNRVAAEAVLALGGSVTVRPEGAEERLAKTAGELPDAYFRLTRVNLAGVTRPLGDLWPRLRALADPAFDSLQALDLSGTAVQEHEVQELQALPALEELSLDRTRVSAPDLASLKQLRRLSLAGSGLTDAGLKRLHGLAGLKDLTHHRSPEEKWPFP